MASFTVLGDSAGNYFKSPKEVLKILESTDIYGRQNRYRVLLSYNAVYLGSYNASEGHTSPSSTPWSFSQQKCGVIASVNYMWPPKTVNTQAFNRPIVIQAFNRTTFNQAFRRIAIIQALYDLLSFKLSISYWKLCVKLAWCHSGHYHDHCFSGINGPQSFKLSKTHLHSRIQ